jgi:hypothetical protein
MQSKLVAMNDRAALNQVLASQYTSDWARLNEHYLLAAIAQVASYLQASSTSVALPETIHPPAAIDQLCQMFRLSNFERAIVLLCAGMELQSDFARLLASGADDPQRASPTFSLALTHFPQGHWSALTPESPLRRWHLIELGTAPTLTHSPLRLNERILHFLLGDTQLEPQLIGLVTALSHRFNAYFTAVATAACGRGANPLAVRSGSFSHTTLWLRQCYETSDRYRCLCQAGLRLAQFVG